MKRILIITNLLPHPKIKTKKNENDILLTTEDQIKKINNNIIFQYLYTIPNTNKLLSLISKRWKSYFNVKQDNSFKIKDRTIFVLPINQLSKKLKIRRLLFDLSFFLRRKYIKRIIEEFKPTLIHAHRIDVDGYFAYKISRKYNIPYVLTVRKSKKYALDFIDIKTINSATTVISPSHELKNEIIPFIKKDIKVIPHGIDLKLFYAKNKPLHHPLKFITIARLLDWKYIDQVIKLFSKINDPFIYNIYGEGPEYEYLDSLINKKGLQDSIKLKGHVPYNKVPQILREHDVFILLSFPETFGRVYIEAMSSGLPIIASANTGMDGFIKNNKEGYLIKHKDEKNAIKTLEYIFNNPEALYIMEQEALKTSHKFDWKTIARKINNVYTIL